jgi:hypothetical protein
MKALDDSWEAERRARYEEISAAVAAGSTWYAEHMRLQDQDKQKATEEAAKQAAVLESWYDPGQSSDEEDESWLRDVCFDTEILPDGSFTVQEVPNRPPGRTPLGFASKWI